MLPKQEGKEESPRFLRLDGRGKDVPVKHEIIKQIDRALKLHNEHRARSKYGDLSDLGTDAAEEVSTIVTATIERLAPPGSVYRNANTLAGRVGQLRALRRDYDDEYLSTVQGLIRAELFADFLEMAEHLLQQGYKDAAAVLVGGVLEENLRALCTVSSIPTSVSGRPKKADAMNNELAAAGVYNKLDQKSVTAWLDLRNKAAHGEYGQYTAEQVATMLSGVREFAARTTIERCSG
jgi:uncharacterized protein (DUF2164 family)